MVGNVTTGHPGGTSQLGESLVLSYRLLLLGPQALSWGLRDSGAWTRPAIEAMINVLLLFAQVVGDLQL